ncbi:SDR family oxidoreductase [Sodalis sp. C49]|uniref:SDR family oxidoreductase n=1 Tax=Sodalis sp. C49 TaxID=3228929 RepID=UPI0039659CBC
MSVPGRVLITGASRGIGRATALTLAAKGHDLVLWARSGSELISLAEECLKFGIKVEYSTVDISDPIAVTTAAKESLYNGANLSAVVLNAGQGLWTGLEELSETEWKKTLDINLNGTFYTLKACIPLLTKVKYSLVIGILSDSALYPFVYRSAYSAAKAGIRSLLDITRLELRSHSIRVSLLFPSRVDTYFNGSHVDAKPGTRADALSADDISQAILMLFELPETMEIREMQVCSISSSFGPYK